MFDFDEVLFPDLWQNSVPNFKKTYEILYFGPQTYLDSDGAVILVSNHRFNHTMV
ncbi:hypothetical protein GCM10023314_04760 [Algibacter agarivorans]|uniref:Uncharacterized protein n=1 Tax=Algibacter agarivorans TaxID=1109741 RepID=A0ABP9GC76_9FLAO